jgi:hypothetical protein
MNDLDPSLRSAVSNGTKLFLGDADARTAPARRYKDLVRELTNALPPNKRGAVTNILVKRCAALLLRSEQLDSEMSLGEAVNPMVCANLAATTLKLLTAIGIAGAPTRKRHVAGDLADDPLAQYVRERYPATHRADHKPRPRAADESLEELLARLGGRVTPADAATAEAPPEPLRAPRRLPGKPGRPRRRVTIQEA